MGKTALLFTGQGSQISGMGKDFYENFSCSKNIFEIFNNTIGKNISEIAFCGTDDELKQTINSQPCILATELAIFEAFKQEINLQINFSAGHSLGEYAALYAADVINAQNTANLIFARATAMSKVNKGSMSAIIGLSDALLKEVLKEASSFGYVDAANYNTPAQTVITGENEAVSKANEIALSKGAKRAIPLAVSGAFHSKLMIDAAKDFEIYTKNAELADAKFPVITNIDAAPTIKAEDFRQKMPAQIYSPVRWVETLNYLKEQGTDHFIEIGPSKILSGMVRKTLSDVKISAICTMEDLENFVNELKIEV